MAQDCGLKISLDDVVDAYLLRNFLRPATQKAYRTAARRWTAEMGITQVSAITTDHVATWRTVVLERSRGETWNQYRKHLRALLNFAVASGWIDSNPFRQVPPARIGTRLKKTVDESVMRAAVTFLEDPADPLPPGWFWASVVRAFYFTGIRRSELVALEWRDIDLTRQVWRVRVESSKTHRDLIVPLFPDVVQDLELLQARTGAELGATPPDLCQVFNVTLFNPAYAGSTMSPDQVSGLFRRLSDKLHEKITPHRLRHSMATWLARYGQLRTLQEVLGHTSITTTMGYVHPDIEEMRDLISRLPRL